MSQQPREPGRTVKLNPLLIKVEFDPDKLAVGRGAPHTYFTARRTDLGASMPLNARNITPAGLPTTAVPGIIGRRQINKLATATR